MKARELALDVRTWSRALRGFEGPRWSSFAIEAHDVAQQILEIEDWPSACRRCGAMLRRREYVAGLVHGDATWLREQLRTSDGRAFVWGRLVLVAAMLDGFCRESCELPRPALPPS